MLILAFSTPPSPQINTALTHPASPKVVSSIQAYLTTSQEQPSFETELAPLRAAQAEAAREEAARVAAFNAWLQSIRNRVHAPGTFDSSSYGWGQCTWYVASRISVPAFLGNANEWGYTLGGVHESPVAGAIAWTTAGYYGHVALVEQVGDGQVLISEMNYAGAVGVVDYRWAPVSEFQYLY